jgi:hypothetical protein
MVLRLVLIVLTLGAVLAALLSLFSETGRWEGEEALPWNVRVGPDGGASALGVALGASTLAELEARLGERAQIALFRSPGVPLTVEAYWNNVQIGPFIVKLAASLEADSDRIDELAARARRSEPMPSGARKLTLDAPAEARVREWPVSDLTYAPTFLGLEPDTLRQRFGPPASVAAAGPEGEVWLYPSLGVAITLATDGRDVIHYVRPRDFARLRERLLAPATPDRAAP